MSRTLKIVTRFALVVLLLATFPGCRPRQQVYQVKGVVEEVQLARKKVQIAHEPIPNYMDAMTMEFDVKSTNELTGLQTGDIVTFRMVVTDDDGWIEAIKKTGTAPPKTNTAPSTTRVVRDVEELKVGDELPGYTFTNQLGQVVRTGDFKGRSLALTFIFTRCPFPVYCPRMSTNFAQVQARLKALPNAPTNWHLLTISFDPRHDTPAVLKAYGEQYRYDPGHWTLATGDPIEITALGDHFGLMYWWPDPGKAGDISHNVRTVVIDAKGRVRKIYESNEWTVDDLVGEMVKAAAVP